MVFSSLTFLFLFLPIVISAYFLMPNRKLKNLALFISSLLFYAWGEPVYIVLILISTISDYSFSLLIEKSRAKGKEKSAKIFLVGSLIVNLGFLVFFKYADFLIGNINLILGTQIAAHNLPLPIGISFYTFQTMSYTIDVYRGDIKAQRNLLTMATYVALFPQLVAGPIVRYQTIEDELENREESLKGASFGIRRFIIGLGKKVIIANQMGLIADTIFNSPETNPGTLLTWFAAIAYTFQIYYDFSGYSDMAIGLGQVFGFNFLENFNYPYISTSITEFWRRWHISLGTWFRDYVYIPLGGNRSNHLRNIFVVWFLTGLWHGASWNFILWGMFYCVLLIAEKYILNDILEKSPKFIQHMYALFFIIIGWVLFRIEDMSQLLVVLKTMFSFEGTSIRTLMFTYQDMFYAIPFVVLAALGSTPIFKTFKNKIEDSSIRVLHWTRDLYLIGLLVITVMLLVGETFNPFIYFKF